MLVSHEVKGSIESIDETHIRPAFGNRKCPRLVSLVDSSKRDVRVNALRALCSELKTPASLVGCIESGIVDILNAQTSDPDPLTRQLASNALEICALNANGRFAMLSAHTADAVRSALNDDERAVRQHIYQALIGLSTGSTRVVQSLVAANYPALLVSKAANEAVDLQPFALRLLCNCLHNDAGLEAALGHSAVETCLMLIQHRNTYVRAEAANTLARLCFAEIAKKVAIDGGAVGRLVSLIKDPDMFVRAAALGALMAITTTDQGKRAMVPHDPGDECDSINLLVNLLHEGPDMLRINTLKCIANVAVHPIVQEQLQQSKNCLGILSRMCVHDNELVAKHASIAKNAVLWQP